MRALSAEELLNVWDQAADWPAHKRALALLAAACPERPADEFARLSIGERDALLLDVRERTFGPGLTSLAMCPGCGEQMELVFAVADIAATPPPGRPDVLLACREDYRVRFRLPNSLDLAAVAEAPDLESARGVLLGRCVLTAEREDAPVTVEDLPDPVVAAVADAMATADPQGYVQLDCACLSCGTGWQADFDIGVFLWTEICAWARRTLREVHLLATAYGWREADVLALSPRRRALYLEMASE